MSLKGEVLLVYLPGAAPESFLKQTRERFPELEVRWFDAPVVDSAFLPPDHLPDEAWEGVTMLCIYHQPDPAKLPRARFFQAASAGLDMWAGYPKFLDPKVQFANASGCQPYVECCCSRCSSCIDSLCVDLRSPSGL